MSLHHKKIKSEICIPPASASEDIKKEVFVAALLKELTDEKGSREELAEIARILLQGSQINIGMDSDRSSFSSSRRNSVEGPDGSKASKTSDDQEDPMSGGKL